MRWRDYRPFAGKSDPPSTLNGARTRDPQRALWNRRRPRPHRIVRRRSWDTWAVQDRAAERRQRMTVRRFSSHAAAEAHDREYWAAIPPDSRVLQAWKLSQEQWFLSDRRPDEPGFCRSVASVRRS